MSQIIKLYFTSSMINMFRTLMHPSSGACDFFIASIYWLCVLFRCVSEFRYGWVGVVSVLQAEAYRTDTTPTQPQRNSQHTSKQEHATNVVMQ